MGPNRERLFEGVPGREAGDSCRAFDQGCPLASPGFAVGLQPNLISLDSALAAVGGCARAIADDVIAAGPAEIVFGEVRRFLANVEEELGLRSQLDKNVCFSWAHDLAHCEHRAELGEQALATSVWQPSGVILAYRFGDSVY